MPQLEKLKPVFIVGTPKSGTTFLLSLFDSHPSVITLFESRVYHVQDFHAQDPAESLRVLEKLLSHGYDGIHPAISRGRLIEKLKQYPSGDGQSVAQSFLYAFLSVICGTLETSRVEHLTHFIEKTPDHHQCAEKIFRDFSNAKIIHVLRDPRDNYLALKRMMAHLGPIRGKFHPISLLDDWMLSSINDAYANVSKFRGQYRVLFYEDLIRNGERIMRELAGWLELSWNDALLASTFEGKAWKGNSMSVDLKDALKPFDHRTIGRWLDALSSREIRMLEYIIDSYGLSGRYPLSRSPSRIQLIFDLFLPFREEVVLEFRKLRKHWWSLWYIASFIWNYWRRRWEIYLHPRYMYTTFTKDDYIG